MFWERKKAQDRDKEEYVPLRVSGPVYQYREPTTGRFPTWMEQEEKKEKPRWRFGTKRGLPIEGE